MECRYCGNDLPEGATTCPLCGGEVPQQQASEPDMSTQKPASVFSSPSVSQSAEPQSGGIAHRPDLAQAPSSSRPTTQQPPETHPTAPPAGSLQWTPPTAFEQQSGYQPPTAQPPVTVEPSAVADPPKERIVYVLLGLFLGGLGVHNFYAGYLGRGIAQLILTLFFFWLIVPLFVVSIWVIIELIVVKKDAQGRPFV